MPTMTGPDPAMLEAAGLDKTWSRFVTFTTEAGRSVTWHVLDTGMQSSTTQTLVCVHGNPTWSYLFTDLLRTLSPDWRVIAIDQSGMGYSERTGPRRLAERIDELVAFCQQVVTGPLSFAAHDWGGPVAVGACGRLDVQALILANTAVAKPDDVAVPPLISLSRRFVDLSCRRTASFVRGTSLMTTKEHRHALNAPYRSATRRASVADFVADIPLENDHPSRAALDEVGRIFDGLTIPILLLWGAHDMVFHDRFLSDLRRRQPQATVERFENSGHLVLLDGNVGPTVAHWLHHRSSMGPTSLPAAEVIGEDHSFSSAFSSVERNSTNHELLYQGPDGTLSWIQLAERAAVAAGVLASAGVVKGSRVALLIPPSPDLLVAVAGLWHLGAIPVVVDPSSGLRALRRQLRAQAPTAVLGTRSALAAATVLRWTPGARRLTFGAMVGALNLKTPQGKPPMPVNLSAEDLAAIVHTSGATGPAKAVAYTHGALVAQRSPIEELLGNAKDGALTTSFAAFSLLAPALERSFIRPRVPIDQPSKLGFEELSALTSAHRVSVAWLSPASARQLVATAKGRHLRIARILLAGAPISPSLATAVADVSQAVVLSPYGMTECLPITDGVGAGEQHHSGGVVVGQPVSGAVVLLRNLSNGDRDVHAGQLGELLVAAPWMYASYDQRHLANEAASVFIDGVRFHATGDVGIIDEGRVIVLGRLRDVIHTADRRVAPLEVETPLSQKLHEQVAVVGVGPVGAEVAVAVVNAKNRTLKLAATELAALARSASPIPLAAVLIGKLAVDHRHQSKVDHAQLKRAATALLNGA